MLPHRWPSVTAAAKKAYKLRYKLLTYIYSSMYTAHTNGGTVLRPLFFTAPGDVAARSAKEQWMVGESLLVSPVVRPQTTTIEPYFTAGAWYSAQDYSPMFIEGSTGQAVQMEVPLGEIAVHYRGGTIIPVQQYAPVTREVRYSAVTLVVALPSNTAGEESSSTVVVPPYATEQFCRTAREQNPNYLVSCGTIFMDSEADAPVVTADNSVQTLFTAVAAADGRTGRLSSTVVANAGDAAGRLRIIAVHILGVGSDPMEAAAVRINGVDAAGQRGVSFDAALGVLKIEGLQFDVGQDVNIQWSV